MEALKHITTIGTVWNVSADDGRAPGYIMMDHSIEEEPDCCTKLIAMADRDLVVNASLLEDGIGRERCCAFVVTEHFHVEI